MVSEQSKRNAVYTLAPLTSAAVTTAVMMYPIDVLRALKMSSAGDPNGVTVSQYYRKFGLKGFCSQGIAPEIFRSTVMRVSKFFFFPIMCEGLFGKSAKEASVGEKAIAGALATVPEILMISPLEVAKLGLQLDTKNKFKNDAGRFLKHMVSTRGPSSIYVGWHGMQWRQSFWTGTYFATLQLWKDLVTPTLDQLGAPKESAQLIAGFLAGFVASVPDAPGDVVRSVVQKKVFLDPQRPIYSVSPSGALEHVRVANEIVTASGVRALFSGLSFKAVHLGGCGALMAVFIPMFSRAMGIEYSGV